MQCNYLTDILDLVYLRFAKNVQRVHLYTEVTAESWMLEPFGESGVDVPKYISLKMTVKSYREKIVLKALQLVFNPTWEIISFTMILMWLIPLYCKWILPAYILDRSIKFKGQQASFHFLTLIQKWKP